MSAALRLTEEDLYRADLAERARRWRERVRAEQAAIEADLAARPPKTVGPAMQRAMDALAENARGFAEVRIEEMRRLRIEERAALSGRYGRARP